MRSAEWDAIARTSAACATRAAYAAFSPEACGCSYCRNFRLQADRIPACVRSLLIVMGIDFEKPVEIVDYGADDKGGRLYEIEWPFLHAANTASADLARVECDGCTLSVSSGGIPCPEFDAVPGRSSVSLIVPNVPWLLGDPEAHA